MIATPTLRRLATLGVGEAGDRHQPGDGLDHEVVARPLGVGAGRPVAADRQVDEAAIERLERGVGEAQPLEAADPEVLDQDVGAADQAPQDLAHRPAFAGRAGGCACSG